MTKVARRNSAYLGIRDVNFGGKNYNFDWGPTDVTISDGQKKISLKNQHVADKLGHMKIEAFLTREFRRVSK